MTTAFDPMPMAASFSSPIDIALLWPALACGLLVFTLFKYRLLSLGLTPLYAVVCTFVLLANLLGRPGITPDFPVSVGSVVIWPATFVALTLVYLYRDPSDLRHFVIFFVLADLTTVAAGFGLSLLQPDPSTAQQGYQLSSVTGLSGLVGTFLALGTFIYLFELFQRRVSRYNPALIIAAYLPALLAAIAVDTLIYSGSLALLGFQPYDTLLNTLGQKLVVSVLYTVMWSVLCATSKDYDALTLPERVTLRDVGRLVSYFATGRRDVRIQRAFGVDSRAELYGHRRVESYIQAEFTKSLRAGTAFHFLTLSFVTTVTTSATLGWVSKFLTPLRHLLVPQSEPLLTASGASLRAAVAGTVKSLERDGKRSSDVVYGAFRQNMTIAISGAYDDDVDTFVNALERNLRQVWRHGDASIAVTLARTPTDAASLSAFLNSATVSRSLQLAPPTGSIGAATMQAPIAIPPHTYDTQSETDFVLAEGVETTAQWILSDLSARVQSLDRALNKHGLKLALRLLAELRRRPASYTRQSFILLSDRLLVHYKAEPSAFARIDEAVATLEPLYPRSASDDPEVEARHLDTRILRQLDTIEGQLHQILKRASGT